MFKERYVVNVKTHVKVLLFFVLVLTIVMEITQKQLLFVSATIVLHTVASLLLPNQSCATVIKQIVNDVSDANVKHE